LKEVLVELLLPLFFGWYVPMFGQNYQLVHCWLMPLENNCLECENEGSKSKNKIEGGYVATTFMKLSNVSHLPF